LTTAPKEISHSAKERRWF